jgi:hypothetical protein
MNCVSLISGPILLKLYAKLLTSMGTLNGAKLGNLDPDFRNSVSSIDVMAREFAPQSLDHSTRFKAYRLEIYCSATSS